jgi:outer membrane protein assembly factor BamB
VYFASTKGTLFALNATTGALECSIDVHANVDASPDVVAAPDGSGSLVLLDALKDEFWAVYGVGNTHGQCSKDWTFSGDSFPGGWSSAAYGTDANGTPIVVFGSKDTDDSVYGLNASTGALIWKYQTSTKTEQDVGGSPTIAAPGTNGIADGAAYIEGKDGKVYALDLTTGALLWSFTAASPGESASSPALIGNTLIVGSSKGVFALNATTGAEVWTALPEEVIASPAVSGASGSQVAFLGGRSGDLYGVSVATGKTVWTSPGSPDGYFASPAISGSSVYDIDFGGVLTSYSLPSG